MPKYVVLENKQIKVVELAEMLPSATVIAEVIDEEKMLVVLKNPMFSINDVVWRIETMFVGDPITLAELEERYKNI